MRVLVALALIAAALPAVAADWNRYENTRYGFGVDVPPELHALPATTSTGDQQFVSIGGDEVLIVSGGSVLPGSFNQAWERTQAAYEADGWTLGYEPVAPHWTSFTGEREGRALFVKMLPLCGGTREYAMIALEYPGTEKANMEQVVQQLAASMTRSGTGTSC